MSALKCPNPACPFRFDPKSVPPGATLACPRCQTRFTLADSGVAEVPVPKSRPATVKPKRSPTTAIGGPVVIVITAVLVLVVVGAVTAITIVGRQQKAQQTSGPTELRAADMNFAVTPPVGWVADPAMQTTLAVNAFCYRHPSGKAWIALALRDYETRQPFELEVQTRVSETLDKAFLGVARQLSFAPTTLGGEPARKASFRGETRVDSLPCVGEVTILTHQGIAYWFYAWAVEADAAGLAADLDAFRESFHLLGARPDWKPLATPETIFRSVKDDSLFTLSTTSPAWTKNPNRDPTQETPPAELILDGRIRLKGDRNATATVTVFVIEGTSAQADAMIRARHTPDPAVFGPTALEPATGEIQGDPATPDEILPTRPITRLTAKATGVGVSAVSDKLIVMSVESIQDKTVVAEAVCPLNERAIWERRMVQFVSSLKQN